MRTLGNINRTAIELSNMKGVEHLDKMQELREVLDTAVSTLYEGEQTKEAYTVGVQKFNDIILNSDKEVVFSLFLDMNTEISEAKRALNSLGRKKGAYSISDEKIEGIIYDIVIFGDKVTDACEKAGITPPTLYKRIKDKGYTDVKAFFRMTRQELISNLKGE